MSTLLEHFGLRREPFEGEADPRAFHPSRAHAAALEAIGNAVRRARPLTVLEGPEGAGKTMVLRCLEAELPERFQLVVVERSARRFGGLCTAIARTLGLSGVSRERECRDAVKAHVARSADGGERIALAVDDAHSLPDHWITELLDIVESESIPVVLAADGGVGEASRHPAAARLRRAITERVPLERLQESEIAGYLQALLMSSGARESRVFSPEAVAALHELSAGLPGRIAALGNSALRVAYGNGRDTVDEDSLLRAADRLAGGEPSTPTSARPRRRVGSGDGSSAGAVASDLAARGAESDSPVRAPSDEIVVVDAREAEEKRRPLAAVAGGENQELIDPSRWPLGEGTGGPSTTSKEPSGSLAGAASFRPPRPRPSAPDAEARTDGRPSGRTAGGPRAVTGDAADAPATRASESGAAGPVPSRGGPGDSGGGDRVPPRVPGGEVHGFRPEGPVDAEVQKELMAGMRRPDRPAWDRSKVDPFRSAPMEPAPFGPDMLPVISDPHGSAAEWFRVIRLGLEEWMQERGGSAHSMMVTSAEAEAGKTFVAVNLALLFANEPGCRVLLIDGDLRRPRFEALFGTPGRPGLADVLAGRVEASKCLQFVSEVGLYILPAGRAGNPRDLVSPERMEPALQEMHREADLVILDAPSMEPWADARSMAASVEGVLFVARAGQTRGPDLVRAMRRLDRSNLIGAVVTDADAERSHGERGRRS